MAEVSNDGEVVAFSMPLHDLAVRALERQIERIDFGKMPSNVRADLLAILNLYPLVDVASDGGVLIARIRPGIRKVIDHAVAASEAL